MRKVIVHYHLFKNAGTSIDHSLKTSFGSHWCAFDDEAAIGAERLRQLVHDNPAALAVSSHNARLPVPKDPDVRFFPILFLRHPIDRIRSVYDFERQQAVETFGAQLAKRTTLRGYIEARWAQPGDFSVRNFQARRLALPFDRTASACTELWDRTETMFAELPLVGLVEAFNDSVQLFQTFLEPHFPKLSLRSVKLNSTQTGDLRQRLATVRDELGADFYLRVEQENSVDLALYELATRRLRNVRYD